MSVEDIKRVCVVGSGTMGSQIAQQCALHGYDVALNDVSEALLAKAVAGNRAILSRRVAKGRMTEADMEAALARVKPVVDLQEAAGKADFVIEAVFEKLEVKQEVFARLDAICPAHTIFATNSSSIMISKVAEVIKRKDKACNMHFFHPVLVMQLVEVVKGQWTSEETVQIAIELSKRIGRTPVLMTKEISGFLVNRILGSLTDEAYWLAAHGYATPQDIDLAVKLGCNFPMGPFELSDFSGLDVALEIKKRRYAEGDAKEPPAQMLVDLVKAGHLGRKTGKGFYDYGQKDR